LGEDESALERLFAERYQPMVRLAAWLVNDRALAEEIVQDAFVRLVAAGPALTDLNAPQAYLRTAVVNLSRSRLRRLALARRHRPLAAGYAEGPEDYLVDEELASAVADLARRQRECIVLRYSEDLAVDAIAVALGISSGSVKTHLHRGLRSLAQTMGGRRPVAGGGPAATPVPVEPVEPIGPAREGRAP